MLNFTKTAVCCLAVVALSGVSEAGEAIAYRLSNTKEMHFDDGRKAEQHLAAVKKLGCEARMDSHGGHTDVTYRSVKWQVMEVANDELAHQWEDWLKKAGFETVHGHAADHGTGHDAHDGHDHSGHEHAGHSHEDHNHGPGQAEEVSYVLRNWKTIHSRDSAQRSELVALMKGLGCEVRTENHGGHTDVSVRCPQWKHVEVASHQAAAGWQDWLRNNGFETRHEHSDCRFQIGDCRLWQSPVFPICDQQSSITNYTHTGEHNENCFYFTHAVVCVGSHDCRWLFQRQFHWSRNSRAAKHGGLA